MGLVRLIGRGLDTRPKLSPDQLKKARPLRNPDVEFEKNENGEILLLAPLERQGRGVAAWLAHKMGKPTTKKFELEPVGAFCWELCDGHTTVEVMSRKLREAYKMNKLEAEASLTAFLQMLSQRKLITLQVPNAPKK